MGATNFGGLARARRSASSPWPYFIAALAVCWALLIRHHVVVHGSAYTAAPVAILAMWVLMSIAMMAPTAVPVLVSLRDLLASSSIRPWWAFLGGYLAIWLGFAGAAATSQVWLIDLDIVGHDGSSTSRALSAGLLAVAGAYQFTALKRRCVTECVQPMTFFFQHWRGGVRGGLRMGLRHGVSCLGCCWALMLLAFVGGIANIWFMVLSAVIMAVEKLPALSRLVTVPLGVVLLAASVGLAVVGSADHPHPSHHQMSTERVDRTKGTP